MEVIPVVSVLQYLGEVGTDDRCSVECLAVQQSIVLSFGSHVTIG